MSKLTLSPDDAFRRVLSHVHNLEPLTPETLPILRPNAETLEAIRFADHLASRQPPCGFLAERLFQETAGRTKMLPFALTSGHSILIQGSETSPWCIMSPTVTNGSSTGAETNKLFEKWLCPVPLSDTMVTFFDALQKTVMALLVEDDARFATSRFCPVYTVTKAAGPRPMKVKWTLLKTAGHRSDAPVTTLFFDPHGEELSPTMRSSWLEGAYGISRSHSSTPIRVVPFFDLEGISTYFHAPSMSTDPTEPGCLEIRIRMSLAGMMLCTIQAPVLTRIPQLPYGIRAELKKEEGGGDVTTAA